MQPEPAESYLGHELALVLAQVPYELDTGVHIATLSPVMDLTTGSRVIPTPKYFPTDGYVFWWDVPKGNLFPGDVIVGQLCHSTKYGGADAQWYQVRLTEGARADERVFEYIRTTIPENAPLRRLIDGSKSIRLSRYPRRSFFVALTDRLIGPFSSVPSPSIGGGILCEPTDRSGRVSIYSGHLIEDFLTQDRGFCEAVISDTCHQPTKPGCETAKISLRLVRPADLDALSDGPPEEQYLLSDALVVSRACKRLGVSRAERQDIIARLEKLLSKLNEIDHDVDSHVSEGLIELIARVQRTTEDDDHLVKSLLAGGGISDILEQKLKERIEAEVVQRSNEVQQSIEMVLKDKIAERNCLLEELDELRKEHAKLQIDVKEQKERLALQRQEIQAVLDAASAKLQGDRQGLLAELALLAPIFHAAPNSVGGPTIKEDTQEITPKCLVSTRTAITAPSRALSEAEFLHHRLLPFLLENGCPARINHAEDLHAMIVASRISLVPHPGWAAAYSEAVGPSAALHAVSIDPDWLSFDEVWNARLGRAWELACGSENVLQLVLLDGIDRSPSSAWLRPWIHLLAGYAACLPTSSSLGWPDNVRVLATESKMSDCFPVAEDLRLWCAALVAPTVDVMELAAADPTDGHLPLEEWRLKTDVADSVSHAFDGVEKELSECLQGPWLRVRFETGRRLLRVYERLGADPDRAIRRVTRMLSMNTQIREEGRP